MKRSEMGLKRYKTSHGNLSIGLSIKGKPKRIRFVSSDGATGFFATADPALQRALEAYPGFGSKVMLEAGVEEEPVRKELTPVSEVSSWQEARELLRKKPYEVPARALGSPDAIRRAAEERGLEFPGIVEK